jgi:hypothetical protein
MGRKRKSNIHWLHQIVDRNKDEWKLSMVVRENGHLKIIFIHEDGRKWTLCASNTPSDSRSRRNQISNIKLGFKENFDIDVNKNDFSMQLYGGNCAEYF